MKKLLIITIVFLTLFFVKSDGLAEDNYNHDKYLLALEYFNQKDYSSAYIILKDLNGYDTSGSYLAECERQLATIKINSPLAAERLKTEFQNQGIEIDDYIYAFQASKITSLDLSDCHIEDISFLSYFDNLETLTLDNNHIKDIIPLNDMYNLKSLSLSDNIIMDVTALYNLTNLEFLNISQNNIKSIDNLLYLTKISNLDASYNDIESIEALRGFINLTVLNLTNNNIAYLGALSDLTQLEELYLQKNRYQSITLLSNLTNLRILELGYAGQDEEWYERDERWDTSDRYSLTGIAAIANMEKLEVLNLTGVYFNHNNYFSELTNLKELYFHNCKGPSLSTKDVKNLTNLTHLAINGMHPRGAEICEKVLDSLPNLIHLEMQNSGYNDLSFLGKYTSLEYLDISYDYNEKIQSVSFLKKLTNLKTLNMNYIHGAHDFSFLTNMQQLEHLEIQETPIKNFEYISQIPTIKYLDLRGCMLNSIKGIENLKQLEHIAIDGTTMDVSQDWMGRAFSSNAELGEFNNVSYGELSCEKYRNLNLLSGLKNLKYVSIHGDYCNYHLLLRIDSLEYLYNVHTDNPNVKLPPNLKELEIGIGHQNVLKQIGELKHLEHLGIELIGSYAFDLELPYMPELQYLRIGNYPYNPNTTLDLSNISRMENLKCIDFSNINIGNLDALEPLENIKWFRADACNLHDISGLKNSRGLMNLNVANNHITDLSQLSDMPFILSADIQDNPISDISSMHGWCNLGYLNIHNTEIRNLDVIMGLPLMGDVDRDMDVAYENYMEILAFLKRQHSMWR